MLDPFGNYYQLCREMGVPQAVAEFLKRKGLIETMGHSCFQSDIEQALKLHKVAIRERVYGKPTKTKPKPLPRPGRAPIPTTDFLARLHSLKTQMNKCSLGVNPRKDGSVCRRC